jgi:hypothetical protein
MEYDENDPPVEIGQLWFVENHNGDLLREIRILALHPDPAMGSGERKWIYENTRGTMVRRSIGQIGVCPEFNLRYVYELRNG